MALFNDDGSGAYGVGFFERLHSGRSVVDNDGEVEDLVNSIKRNISNILNTRTGESQSCPELGLFDFNDASAGSADLNLKMRRNIKSCLSRFEPRIVDIEVETISNYDDPMSLRFNIQGRIKVSDSKDILKIDLLLDSNRRYKVI